MKACIKFAFSLLLLFLLLGTGPAFAGEFCSTFPDPRSPGAGLIDGSDPATVQFMNDNNVTQITIDTDCTFRNWDPLTVTINFQTNDPSIYLITFDNVVYTGNMACANIEHRIWFVNGDPANFRSHCQDLFIPVEAIGKQVPPGKTTVGIGEVFTYTLTVPVLYDPATGTVIGNAGSANDLHSISIIDDLNAIGADLTLVGTPTVEWAAGSSQSGPVTHNFTNNAGLLNFEILPNNPNTVQVLAGDQIEIKITLSVDDTNAIGTQFFNTATWEFGRLIALDPNDENNDGDIELTFFDPLPGENGVSEILTIGAPDLTVTKSSPDTALNIGVQGSFTIDVQNTGNTEAWDFTIVDEIPGASDNPSPPLKAGMCQFDPTATVSARIFQADGTTAVTPVLTAGALPGADYSISFNNSNPLPCELTLQFDSSGPNGAVLEPGQRLIITYNSELDPTMDQDGALLTNVAGATQWYSADSGGTPTPVVINRTLTDGTPGDPADHQSSHTITAGLSGYFFTKSVQNLTNGDNPASIAAAGDTLRYQLRVFNLDQTINNISIVDDDLIPANYDTASFSIISSNAISESYNPVTGTLTIDGGSVNALNELVIVYDINLASGLSNLDTVSNQAVMTATGTIAPVTASDDPNINGIDDPQVNPPDPDPTVITIRQPGPLLKTDGPATATIGNEITYRITVPALPVATPLYDVRILDDLTVSGADLEFISASIVSGGAWTLTNTGTSSSLVIEDSVAGIDIPADGQAVIDVTVRVSNTLNNQIGDAFNNTATYTYNRVNNVVASQVSGGGDTTNSSTVITEPDGDLVSITKTANNTTPTAGDIVRYSVALTSANGVYVSDMFDVTITDSLDLGLVYAGNPTVTTGGAGGNGAGDNNTITDPDVTGDGVTTPQLLVWSTNEADIDIDVGETVTIEYDVLVLDSVLANQVLNNSVTTQWTGIDGINSHERTGIDGPGGLNDYATLPVVETLTTRDIVATINKTRSTDTYGAGDDDVRIGDIVEYTLTIPVPEGTLGNLTLVDTLPQGLDFESIVSLNGNTGPPPYTAAAPFTYPDIPLSSITEAGNPATGPTTVTWTLGNITNQPNDGLSDDFVIVYTARVLNGDVFTQQNDTPLNNQVTMTYDTAAGTVNSSDIDTTINVRQPDLSITKTASPANGDVLIDSGEVVTYTVEITNNGSAPAYDPVLQDIIPVGLRTGPVTTTSISLVNAATSLPLFAPTDGGGGITTWDFDRGTNDEYTIPPGETLRVEYTVTADNPIAQGLIMTNTATVQTYYSLDDEAVSPTSPAASREDYPTVGPASTTLYTGALPTKTLISPPPGTPNATIGEIVEYQLTVPGTPNASTLYDVQIIDTLDANLEFISTSISGGTGVTDNSTVTPGVLDVSVSEIPAGTQVVINLQARVRNVSTAQQGTTIDNTVSYTYALAPAGPTQPALASIDIVTINVVEPDLTAGKLVTPVTPAPITGGDVLEYTLTVQNTGSATAFDTNIVDTLPAGLTLDGSFTPTAAIDSVPVTGFNASPAGAPAGPLVWGRDNNDASLDIPANSTLVLTYRVLIDASVESNVTLTNSVLADWTSLNGLTSDERTGANCPAITAPDDYCSTPAISTVLTVDDNSFSKTVIDDSFAPNNDAIVRVGDTVTYQLSLNLQEGTTRSVAVNDVLPAGLVFDSIVSINGDTTADYSAPASGAGSNFSYGVVTAGAVPAAGQAGTLTFTLGDVINDPLGDATTDTLTIVYRARVLENTLTQTPSTALSNTATLSFVDGNGLPVVDPARLEDTASIDVLQPVMTVPTKVDAVFTSPTQVNVATDVMQFTLESCNTTGLAPAYDVQLTDALPTQLNEASLAGPNNGAGQPDVYINGVLVAAGVDYNYTPPAGRGGSLVVDMLAPIPPTQCVSVVYDIGFYNDFGPNQVWSNSVTVDEYWSLPLENGQQYTPLGPTGFIMSNAAVIGAPAKTMLSPASGEATIGEEVLYQILVPATATNSALYDVVISDTLNASLTFISATETSGNGFTITDNTSGNNVSLTVAQIPAGQQVQIELRARVANNASANAGTTISNTVGYSYATSPGGATNPGGTATTATDLLIVEPSIAISKLVANQSSPGNPPTAGDILEYTVSLTASGSGATGDQFSSAFDASIIDDLSLGLAYVPGTSSVDGSGNTIADPAIVGDGVTTPQTMTWQLSDATADIDIPENTTVNITYDVVVLNSVLAGQALSNSAVARWTGLDGIDANERTGTGTPVENDYFTAPATTTVTTPDTTSMAKVRLTDTSPPMTAASDVRIGDIVEYQLSAVLQEGQTSSVVLSDTLPQGLAFEGVVQINGDTSAPYSATAPFVHADITPVVSGDPRAGPSTVIFNLGDVINVGDNNPANDTFVVVYRARVLDTVYPQFNTITLTNNAQLNYNTVAGPVTLADTAGITLLQPSLSVTKTAVTGGGDTVIVAGELVTYTVTVTNGGTAPAYDVVIEDIIPAGMRNGAATITVLSTQLPVGNTVPIVAPVYDPATGNATWNFDTGAADAYTIQPGEALQIVYRVQADPDLGAGLTLTNQAVASVYYSFDDDAVPALGGVSGVPEIYGPSNTDSTTLTSPTPGSLLKQTPFELSAVAADQLVSVGDTFTYRITAPETPLPVALHDVRILDNLANSAADLSFVSVTGVGGPYTWTAANTSGSATNLVIEDATNGIDIPAGQQIMLDVTVRVEDTANNVSGLSFINTATYTYNQLPGDPLSQQNGLPDDSGDMIIVGADALTLTKSGPATIRFGTPAVYTLDVYNDNTSGFSAPAWDLTITDVLPELTPGGMCDAAPVITSAGIYDSTGTVLQTTLTAPADYTSSFAGCTLTITMTSANAALPPDSRLIITYDASLDGDTPPSSSLTNIAGVTEWFSNDTAGAGATGSTRTFTRTLSNDPITAAASPDHEDAHTVTSEVPIIEVRKLVDNLTTGQPGTEARPGDTLRYRIEIENVSPVDVPAFSFTDDLDALNAVPAFTAGTLNLVTVPAGADTTATSANGGVNATGLVSIGNLALGPDNSGTELVVIEFDVTLKPAISDGTIVLNQGRMLAPGVNQLTDDILIAGSADPTETRITSAPLIQVFKTSQDLSGDPNILLSGDTLRYTITVKNVGSENAVSASLRDQLPANTTYVAGSTRLNGNAVTDLTGGVLPLQNGILINAPENTTAGFMRADATATTANVATISFDVIINSNVVNGTVISNQAFLSASGTGSGPMPDTPSDDPATAAANDPTLDVVGNQPLVDAHKTVSIVVDNGSPGIVDPGDVLSYTISISNIGSSPATGVTFIDAVPANTTYRPDSATLNGLQLGQPGATVSPLAAGIDVSSSDLPPPAAGNGTLSAGGIAEIIFEVTVNDGVVNAPGLAATPGTVISNQGSVDSNELPTELTDADGIDANGDQPTLIVVGNAQLLSITKQVTVVGGGPALAGGQLEYRVQATNIGTVAATNVVITDDLPGQLSYMSGTGMLNGSSAGVGFASPRISADFATVYGDLQPGATAELRFLARIDGALQQGDTITNTGVVSWSTPAQTDSASVSISVGGTPGVANLNGTLWHDANYNNVLDSGEATLQNWTIDVYRSGQLLGSYITDSNGVYQFNGLLPNNLGTDRYELRFRAPGAGANTALLGIADSAFSNDLQRIDDIVVSPGDNLQDLNLPIDPNGIVYNSTLRTPVAGATLTLLNASSGNAPVPSSCFGDPAQQNQVTLAGGYYKFDMNFGTGCNVGDTYVIQVVPPASGFVGTTSQIIPPTLDLSALPFSVPSCPGSSDDRLSTSPERCEIQASEFAPPVSVAPRTVGTAYYLKFTLGNGTDPYTSQIFNNHIPVDPVLDEAVAISKTSALLNVTRSQLVPYTIVVNNTLGVPLPDMDIVDNFPAGFKYVANSARIDGVASEPVINGLQMSWPNLSLNAGEVRTIKMLLVVGSGVGEGEYINRVQAINNRTGEAVSGQATATVRVIADPTFDCSDVIGKVFDDRNMNGYQDEGETGIPSARVVTARGLEAKTDKHGRFHIACAVVPNEDRGSNFILKLDERSLPTGHRVTTENPRVERATRGKMLKFNFGVATHRVVRLDMADAVFEPNSTEIRAQWLSRIGLLMEKLIEAPSILRLAYMADVEDKSLVEDRLKATRKEIQRRWADLDCCYTLEIETEIFWRRGRPAGKEAFE